jgi:hypothetical protein
MNHCQTKMHPSTCSSDIQRSIHGKQTTLKRREAANKHIERREAANKHMKTTMLRLCFSLDTTKCIQKADGDSVVRDDDAQAGEDDLDISASLDESRMSNSGVGGKLCAGGGGFG